MGKKGSVTSVGSRLAWSTQQLPGQPELAAGRPNVKKQSKTKEGRNERRKKIGGDRCGGAHLGGRGWQTQCEFKASRIYLVSCRSGYRVGPCLKTNTKATIWKQ